MKTKTVLFFICFVVGICIIAISCNKKEYFTIGYVQILECPSLDYAQDGVWEALKESGYEDGKNIKIIKRNAQGDISNIHQILQSFISQDVDLITTNSTPCLISAIGMVKEIPVIFTVATCPEEIGISRVPDNIAGYCEDSEMYGFVSLLKTIMPRVKKIGLPYNPSEPNSELAKEKLRTEAAKNDLELLKAHVSSVSDLDLVVKSLINNGAEVIVASADNIVYSALPQLFRIAKNYRIPVCLTSYSEDCKDALFVYGLDYKEWGKASGNLAAKIIKGEKIQTMNSIPIHNFTLTINRSIADELGIQIPDSLLSIAVKIY